jgi:hypothetical protein
MARHFTKICDLQGLRPTAIFRVGYAQLHQLPLADHHRGSLRRLYGQCPALTLRVLKSRWTWFSSTRDNVRIDFYVRDYPAQRPNQTFTLSNNRAERLGSRSPARIER